MKIVKYLKIYLIYISLYSIGGLKRQLGQFVYYNIVSNIDIWWWFGYRIDCYYIIL